MDLYDDIDTKQRSGQIDGWSSGIKMLQTQLASKKAQPKDSLKKPLMTPVVNLRTKKLANEDMRTESHSKSMITTITTLEPVLDNIKANDWDFLDEYDPQWPNEYEKLKEKHQSKEKSSGRKRGRNRNSYNDSPPAKSFGSNSNSNSNISGFSARPAEEDSYSPPTQLKSVGAAIAPPKSLQEISINNESGDGSSNVTIPYSASSVAAKIMAKYGFKDGQGLGKQEQGMSMALQVEKTSKRGGRIIHEKDVFLPPPAAAPASPPSINNFNMGPPAPPSTIESSPNSEPSITEIMKAPSKVVLLRNMVGPGDVDDELEPEVKDECNNKYGEVNSVIIHELFGTTPEEAVKIYVEFKRIESAIKAVVDLNGRFFGGRQVRAGFFDFDKFKNLQLT